jgi:hypothetical protein
MMKQHHPRRNEYQTRRHNVEGVQSRAIHLDSRRAPGPTCCGAEMLKAKQAGRGMHLCLKCGKQEALHVE